MENDASYRYRIYSAVSSWSKKRRIAATALFLILIIACVWIFRLKGLLQSVNSYRSAGYALVDIKNTIDTAVRQKELLVRELKDMRMPSQSYKKNQSPVFLLNAITASRLKLDRWEIVPDSDNNNANKKNLLIHITVAGCFADLLTFFKVLPEDFKEFIPNRCTIIRKDDSSLECQCTFVFNESVE